jgi:hypothetical protein
MVEILFIALFRKIAPTYNYCPVVTHRHRPWLWPHLTCVRPPQCGRKLVAVRLDYVMRSRALALPRFDGMPSCHAQLPSGWCAHQPFDDGIHSATTRLKKSLSRPWWPYGKEWLPVYNKQVKGNVKQLWDQLRGVCQGHGDHTGRHDSPFIPNKIKGHVVHH